MTTEEPVDGNPTEGNADVSSDPVTEQAPRDAPLFEEPGGATPNAEPGLVDMLADLGRSAQETAASITDGVSGAEDKVRAGLEDAENSIKEHPLLAVGIAAGLGFMLGLMLRGSGGSATDEEAGVD